MQPNQSDRDAAANYCGMFRDYHNATACKNGERDGEEFVQAFARHRLASTTAQSEAVQKLVEALELLEAAYEASSPYIVHNVGMGEVRDQIEDFLAAHRESQP